MRIGEIWTHVKLAAADWVEDKAPQLSAALAYYTIFSIAPLLVIAITIAGVFVGESFARSEIVSEVERYVGKTGAEVISSMIAGARERGEGNIASILSVVFLLFGATGVFAQLQAALNVIWEVPPRKGSGIREQIRNRLLTFLLVLGVGALLLFSAVVSAVLSALTSYAVDYAPGGSVWVYLADLLGTVLVSSLLFALVFKYLPDVKIAWSDVWIGAAITAVLFAVGKIGMGYHLGRGTVASTYGLAGSVMVVLLWTYYSAMILFFGAELTQVYANQFGSRLGVVRAGMKRSKTSHRRAAGERSPGTHQAGGSDPMPEIENEREYVVNEAELAKTAIRATLEDLKHTAQQAANPSLWTRQFPWAAVGIAAAAGLLMGNQFLRMPGGDAPRGSRERRRDRRRDHRRAARLRRRTLELELEDLRKAEARTLGGFLTTIKRAILRLVKMAIRSTMIAAVSAGTAATVQEGKAAEAPAGVE